MRRPHFEAWPFGRTGTRGRRLFIPSPEYAGVGEAERLPENAMKCSILLAALLLAGTQAEGSLKRYSDLVRVVVYLNSDGLGLPGTIIDIAQEEASHLFEAAANVGACSGHSVI